MHFETGIYLKMTWSQHVCMPSKPMMIDYINHDLNVYFEQTTNRNKSKSRIARRVKNSQRESRRVKGVTNKKLTNEQTDKKTNRQTRQCKNKQTNCDMTFVIINQNSIKSNGT